MCHFLSGVISKDGEKFYFGKLNSHSGIEDGHSLKPDSYREFEWTEDDDGQSLGVRGSPDDFHSSEWYKEKILSKFPTRKDLLKYISTIVCRSTKNRELRYNDQGVLLSWDEWFDSGNKYLEVRFNDDGNYISYTTWYDNGQKNVEKIYNDGTILSDDAWFDNGQKYEEIRYNDKGNRIYLKNWFNNGQIRRHYLFDDLGNYLTHTVWDIDGVVVS